jgi:tRNA(Ile2)-agmatinylcytidine synthase
LCGREVLSYPIGGPIDGEALFQRAVEVVEGLACLEDPMTNPGVFVAERPPDLAFYRSAVTRIVPLRSARLGAKGGRAKGFGNGRGLIGAVAATAWRPRDRTYEILTYRARDRWGTPRTLNREAVMRLDDAYPETFHNFDRGARRVLLAPRSPCPILFGIRADRPDRLVSAMESVVGETPDRWLLFETNQGTDDHVLRHPTRLEPRTTVRVVGRVASKPRTLQGGHVLIRLSGAFDIDLVAYEPTKEFRRVFLALLPGDRVTAQGAVRANPRAINVEKLRVHALVTCQRKTANPACGCGRRMKSVGSIGGYRCRSCGSRAPSTAAAHVEVPRTLHTGWYEPPVGARRHLVKPLKRMGLGDAWGAHATVAKISMPIGST